MRKTIHWIAVHAAAASLFLAVRPSHVHAAAPGASPLDGLDWVHGPGVADIGEHARVRIPDRHMFTGAQGTQTILNAFGNPTSGDEIGFLAPTSMVWSVIFEFDDVGYVKDDEKDNLDPDAMLKSIKEGTEYANRERAKMGSPPLHITGWHKKPSYNESTHNLEWAIRGETEGNPVLNYNTRLLGRRGVISVTLLIDPDELDAALPQFQSLLAGFEFKQGQKYAEYKSGDKLAQYGLAALIVGGAAAGAAKLGLFAGLAVFLKKAWKLVVIAVVGVAAACRRFLFGRNKSDLT